MPRGALFDVDGTLVDNTYLHAVAFARAFAECGVPVATVEIHRRVGMGGGDLIRDLLGDDVDPELAEALQDGHSRHVKGFEDDMRPFPGASALLRALAERGVTVVLATSAEPEEVDHRVSLLDVGDAVKAITCSGDVEQAKPAPDIFQVAAKAGGLDIADCIAIGDATWDIIAARAAGIDCIGLESGGFSEAELREAGAVAVYKDTAALLAGLEQSVLA